MTMSERLTLASEAKDNEMRAALAAGWRRSDLLWERAQEQANACYLAGVASAAVRLWRRAGWVAWLHIPAADPRPATTLANLALADRLSGHEARARRRYGRARRHWRGTEHFIAGLSIARRGRSSLFHLRMEALHWDTYADNLRTRLRAFADEAAQALAALEENQQPECRLFERWRGEKPPVFDDTRKLLSAVLLIGGGAQAARSR